MKREESRKMRELIRADYLAGIPRQEILIKYSVKSLIGYTRELHRKRVEPIKKISPEIKDKMLLWHKEGKNHHYIAEQVGISPSYVVTKLRGWGQTVHKIERKKNDKKTKVIHRELTPGEQRIKDKLKNWDIESATYKEIGIIKYEGLLEPLITIRPKNYF